MLKPAKFKLVLPNAAELCQNILTVMNQVQLIQGLKCTGSIWPYSYCKFFL